MRRIIALWFLGVTFVCAIPAWAKPKKEKEPGWEEMNLQVNALRRRAQYAEAIELGQKAVAAAEKNYGPESSYVAVALRNLALSMTLDGKFLEAKPLLERALRVEENASGPDSLFVATLLADLADVRYALNEQGDLGGMYKRALSIRQKALGVDDLLVAQAMHGLARFHTRTGDYTDAEKLYTEALTIIRGHSLEHIYMPFFMKELAKVYSLEGKRTDSDALMRRAQQLEARLENERQQRLIQNKLAGTDK